MDLSRVESSKEWEFQFLEEIETKESKEIHCTKYERIELNFENEASHELLDEIWETKHTNLRKVSVERIKNLTGKQIEKLKHLFSNFGVLESLHISFKKDTPAIPDPNSKIVPISTESVASLWRPTKMLCITKATLFMNDIKNIFEKSEKTNFIELNNCEIYTDRSKLKLCQLDYQIETLVLNSSVFVIPKELSKFDEGIERFCNLLSTPSFVSSLKRIQINSNGHGVKKIKKIMTRLFKEAEIPVEQIVDFHKF